MRASGRDCSFLHAGTKTVMSWWPRSKNQSTASWIPWHENTSLLPWLQENMMCLQKKSHLLGQERLNIVLKQQHGHLMFLKTAPPYLIATLLPSSTTGRRFSLSCCSCDGQSKWQESKEELEEDDVKEEEENWDGFNPPWCSESVLVPSLTSSPSISLMSASGPSFFSTSNTSSSE